MKLFRRLQQVAYTAQKKEEEEEEEEEVWPIEECAEIR
jgi:hypothetical protein